MKSREVSACLMSVVLFSTFVLAAGPKPSVSAMHRARPRVVLVGVNGAEWDIIRPLLIRGEMPNLASVIAKGVYGKLRTLSSTLSSPGTGRAV
jgi:hypothetical protein